MLPLPGITECTHIGMTVCLHSPMVIRVAVGRAAARTLIGSHVRSTSGGRRHPEVRWVSGATVPSAAVALALFQPRGEPHVVAGTGRIHLRRLKIHIASSIVDDVQLGRSHDPDLAGRKALVSTRRHGRLRNSRAPTEHHVPTSWESWVLLWDTKKAVSQVFPGHGLDLLRARRDSNP